MQQATSISPAAETTARPVRKWRIGAGAVIAVLVIAFVAMMFRMTYVPNDLDTSTTVMTAQGLFRTSYVSDQQPVPINQMHSWVLHVETPDGEPVVGATIGVDGDMPQHGHGLPTRPQVTADLGNGDYLVEGVKFHMPGWWVMDFTVESEHGVDSVRFNLMLR